MFDQMYDAYARFLMWVDCNDSLDWVIFINFIEVRQRLLREIRFCVMGYDSSEFTVILSTWSTCEFEGSE